MRKLGLPPRSPNAVLRAFGAALLSMGALATPAFADAPAGPSAQHLYERGIAERKAARPDAAVALLSLAAAREPDNADIRLQLALALMAVKRVDAAERELLRAQRLAPGYPDVEITLAYIDIFRGRLLQAEVRAEKLLRRYPEREDVLALVERISPRTPVHDDRASAARNAGLRLSRFDGSISYSRLSGKRTPWREAVAVASFTSPAGDFFSAALEQASRFENNDTSLEVRYETRLAAGVGAFVSAGSSPGAAFKPEAAFAAGGWLTLAANEGALDAMRFTASARHARYGSGGVTSVFLGIEAEFWDGALFAAAQLIGVLDETGTHRTGHRLQTRVQPFGDIGFRCGWAMGPDSSEGRTFLTRTLFAGVDFPLSPQITASATYAHDELEGLYERSGGTLSLAYRFPS